MEDTLQTLLGGLFCGIVTAAFAWRWRFFSFPKASKKAPVSFVQVVTAFAIYVGLSALFAIIGFGVIDFLTEGVSKEFPARGWIMFAMLACGGGGLLLYSTLRGSHWSRRLWSGPSNLALGAVIWLVASPWVVVVGHFTSWIVYILTGQFGMNQVAVRQLLLLKPYPLLLTVQLVALITLIPLWEELLFRGFLQSWLRNHLSRCWAIGVTSIFFAGSHFSLSQGFGNIEIFVSLFTLSCFLGFLFERQRTLWASIGLHGTFNGISSMMILLFK